MVSRLCDDGVQGRDGRCVENSSCFQIFLFVPVCILLLGSPAGLILILFLLGCFVPNFTLSEFLISVSVTFSKRTLWHAFIRVQTKTK